MREPRGGVRLPQRQQANGDVYQML